MSWSRWTAVLGSVSALALLAALVITEGSRDDLPEPDPPVGTAVLPDLMPSPQLNVGTKEVDGEWHMFFDTVITNVGESDFVLRAKREVRGTWTVEQGIPYSEGGAEIVPTDATLAWGGDGHDHWHVVRVATVRLVALDGDGRPKDEQGRTDTKIGFCFYDHTHELERGPEKAVYSAHSCGHEDDTLIGVGLSPGWNDTYLQTLPGQNINIDDLPEGRYRLWTDIDEDGWFREANRENNRTWIDLDIQRSKGLVTALRTAIGPKPS